MGAETPTDDARPCILILDGDVLSRHAIAEYLRGCGYRVVEATTSEELLAVLDHGTPLVDTILFDLDAPGAVNGFALRALVREAYPGIDVIATGSTQKAAKEAANLCEEGPELARPYDPQLVIARIRRMQARRDESE
ncbi:MAG: response regulator [Pseudomonadota bacterium]